MSRKSRYITEEFLERRLDERFAEQAELVQSGFSNTQNQINELREITAFVSRKLDDLFKKVDDGFSKLDSFANNIDHLEEAEVMNQAAHRRFDDRLTSLEA